MKKKEKWQMWSLRWTENPEERDRNPSSPQMVSVAQLVRALVCGTRGRGFETHHSPKNKSVIGVMA